MFATGGQPRGSRVTAVVTIWVTVRQMVHIAPTAMTYVDRGPEPSYDSLTRFDMAAPTLTPGQTLGHFRLVEEIGSGGMGVVYRARDTRLERDVAVKVLNAKTLSDVSARKRFRSEALILSRLNHPNVESVYDFHSEQGVDYLVLEYVPGTSLNERLEKGAVPENEVLALGIQLTRGLAAAHAQGIIHRDLKPGNLRVRPDSVLKILDFGLAQLFALPEDKTVTTDEMETLQLPFAGTPPYLSPEQVAGSEPDIRSDIYSAGVVLYEMATGSRPFAQRGQMLRDAIVHSLPPAPRIKNKDISPDLEAVILKCLEKGPKPAVPVGERAAGGFRARGRGARDDSIDAASECDAIWQDSKGPFRPDPGRSPPPRNPGWNCCSKMAAATASAAENLGGAAV